MRGESSTQEQQSNSDQETAGHQPSKKLLKTSELFTGLMNFFSAEMEYGERIRMSRLSKSLSMSDGSKPHVDTVRAKCAEIAAMQRVATKLSFYFENGDLAEIEKVEPRDAELQKNMQDEITLIKLRLDKIDLALRSIMDRLAARAVPA